MLLISATTMKATVLAVTIAIMLSMSIGTIGFSADAFAKNCGCGHDKVHATHTPVKATFRGGHGGGGFHHGGGGGGGHFHHGGNWHHWHHWSHGGDGRYWVNGDDGNGGYWVNGNGGDNDNGNGGIFIPGNNNGQGGIFVPNNTNYANNNPAFSAGVQAGINACQNS